MPAQRCRHRDGRTQLRQLKAGRKAQQQHSSPGAVRLHSQNAHSSALLARWARPMCTAVTARSGAPFAQTEPFAAHPRVEKNTCAKRRHNL